MLPTLIRAQDWTAQDVRITLLDTHRYLYYSGMVPEYLGGVYTQDQVRIDLAALCANAGIEFAIDPVVGLSPNRRTLQTASGRRYSYDLVAFDIGARNPGRPAADAIQTKPLHHIEQLAQQIDTTLETPNRRLRLVIAGGGAAGVEVGLNVAYRFRAAERAEALALTIVEQHASVLDSFPEGMRRYATHKLANQGVALRTGTRIDAISDGQVTLSDGRSLPADAVLWATGSVGHPWLTAAGLPTDDRDFIRVLPSLRPPGYPRVFAAGDCATVIGNEAKRKVGVHAVKQGPILRDNLEAAIQGLRCHQASHAWALTPFRPYAMAPLILSTGTREGLWTADNLWMRGRPILRLKHAIDRRWIRPYNGAFRTGGIRGVADASAAACEG